uniref:Uncharacterized protein n=1 Tax=Equus caballus TaxID=9796 RepID=A0A9L0R1G7_HORSE
MSTCGLTVLKNHIHVRNQTRHLHAPQTSLATRGLTLEKSPMNVNSVGKISLLLVHFKYAKEFILERNPMNIHCVVKPSTLPLPFEVLKEVPLERNSINIRNVGKTLVDSIQFGYMKEITLERNYQCKECEKSLNCPD